MPCASAVFARGKLALRQIRTDGPLSPGAIPTTAIYRVSKGDSYDRGDSGGAGARSACGTDLPGRGSLQLKGRARPGTPVAPPLFRAARRTRCSVRRSRGMTTLRRPVRITIQVASTAQGISRVGARVSNRSWLRTGQGPRYFKEGGDTRDEAVWLRLAQADVPAPESEAFRHECPQPASVTKDGWDTRSCQSISRYAEGTS
jgi:hypothetical protein